MIIIYITREIYLINKLRINMLINEQYVCENLFYLKSTSYSFIEKLRRSLTMTLAHYFDRRDQIMSVVDATSTSERDAICAISQKKQIIIDDILKKLNKLRLLYEFNEQIINVFVFWEKMKRLRNMIDELTRQRVAKSTTNQRKAHEKQTNNQRMKTQLKKLKKIIVKLEKKSIFKKKLTNNWVKIINEKQTKSISRQFNANITSSTRNSCEKFEIKMFIKEKKKIKKIMTTITKNIVNKAKDVVVAKTFSTRKNIEIIKRRSRLFIFRVKTKKSKKILEKNDFWIKEISSSASTRNVNYDVMIHEMKMKKISQNMKKKDAKTFTKINANIHSRMKINKVKWLTKKNAQKKYAFLIARVVNAKKTNKLIESEMCHESNIKITQFYDSRCKVYQCLKCQKYDHKIYECKNNQKCVYCALNHKSKLCFHKQMQNMWKCETCRDAHKIFDSRCHKQQIEKKKLKKSQRTNQYITLYEKKTHSTRYRLSYN